VFLALTNVENDFERATDDTSEYGIGIIIDDSQFKIIERSAGSTSMSAGYHFSLDTDYYIQLRRVEPHTGDAVGSTTYGYAYADIYSNSDYSTLITTLSLELSEYPRIDMQYVLPISSYNTGDANACSLVLSDMVVARPSLEYSFDNASDPYFRSKAIFMANLDQYKIRLYHKFRSSLDDPTDTTPDFTDRTDLSFPYDTDTSITANLKFHFEYSYFIWAHTRPYFSFSDGEYSSWRKLSSTPVEIPKTLYIKWRFVPEFSNSSAINLKFYQINYTLISL
jgi:hypothetical protein